MAHTDNLMINGVLTPVTMLDSSAQEIDDAAQRSKYAGNPNLLDNWYFADPINQRGVTTCSVNQYGIDRWKAYGASYTVADRGLSLAVGCILTQALETHAELVGKTLTLSALLADGTIKSGFGVFSGSGSTVLFDDSVVKMYITASGYVQMYARVAVNIVAVKLELGSVQTLAHQDANGKWVLNDPPPNKDLELLKCCMSTADSSDTYANNKATPAAINAVNKAGDTMTGALCIDNGDGSGAKISANVGHSYLTASTDLGNSSADRRFIDIATSYKAELATAFRLADAVSGKTTYYPIHHTGNKPSGYYTGNGDATARTIDTKGLGDVCIIYGGGGIAIVTSNGAICGGGDGPVTPKSLSTSAIRFNAGVLTIKTTDSVVNANGGWYNYKVL